MCNFMFTKMGVTTQWVYKIKQRCRTILNLEEKMRWILHQAWPFQRYYILREVRIADQVSICVYKAYTFNFLNDWSFQNVILKVN